MKSRSRGIVTALACLLGALLAACGPTVTQVKPQKTVTIGKSFQSELSGVPTVPSYRCGAWTSVNDPGTYSTISIYAKLVTKDVTGVKGASASAVAHFQSGDVPLDQQPASDPGGYVTFTLQLQGRQPGGVPATIDVSFNVGGHTVQCTPAFFTPQ